MIQTPEADGIIARSAMAKAMWRIVPLILLAYVIAYMDRVNVSFASLQMNDDLKFSATIYGLGGGLFFLGYALFEVPSSLMLVRFTAPQWIARIMITWGLLAAGMMFVPRRCSSMSCVSCSRRGRVLSERDLLLFGLVPDGWAGVPSAESMWQARWHPSSWAVSLGLCSGSTAQLVCEDGNGSSLCRVCPRFSWA